MLTLLTIVMGLVSVGVGLLPVFVDILLFVGIIKLVMKIFNRGK